MSFELLCVLYVGKAGCADLLSLDFSDTLTAAAEKAGGVIFGENDKLSLGVYFDRVGVLDSHIVSDFFRYDDTSEFVYVSYNSGRFH